MRAHGDEVIGGPLSERNNFMGSRAFGYGERNLLDSLALELANFVFEITLRLVPERAGDLFIIDRVVILHAGVGVDRDLVGPEQKDFQF